MSDFGPPQTTAPDETVAAPVQPQAPATPPVQAANPAPQAAPVAAATDTSVNVKNPDGDIVSIPQSQYQEAVQSRGYQPVSPEEEQQYFDQQDYGSAGQQAATVAEGAAKGVLGPLAPGIEEAFGVPGADIQGRERTNPWEHGGAEAATLIGGAALGTGEGALLAKTGEATAKMLGPSGASAMAKIGARTVSDAAQMVLYQGGNEVSKMIEGDPNQSLGTALADVGLSGLIGAGAGAVFGAVSPLWSATVGTKAGQMVEDFKGRLKFLHENPDPVQSFTDELGGHMANMGGAADEVYGANGLKARGISGAMPEMSPEISGQAQGISDRMGAQLEKMKADPNSYPPRLVSKLQADYDRYMTQVTDPSAGSNEIFNAGQELKQQLQGYSKFDKFVKPVDEAYDFVKDSKGLSHDLRTSLEDKEVWGKAGDLQQKINTAFKEYLPTLEDAQKKFTTEVAGERQIDPGKINTYLNSVGKPGGQVRQQMLQNYLEASEKYSKVINDVHSSLGSESPIKPSPMNVVNSTLGKVTPGGRLADYFFKQGLAELAGHSAGVATGAGIGHLAGSGGFGAVIGERALGPMFSSVFHSIAKPVMEGVGSSKGFKSAVDYATSVARGETMMTKAAKAVFKAGGEVASPSAMPTEMDRARLNKQLQKLQTDPTPLTKVAGDVGHYLPQHATAAGTYAANAVNYLNSLRPKTTTGLPLDSKIVPNGVAQGAYNRALDIAEQPLVVTQAIKSGRLTPSDVVTLSTVNPGAYQRLSQKLTAEMTNHISKGGVIPYQTRMSLSTFIGQPLDSTMTPQGIQGAQPQPPMQQPATPTQPASNPKRSTAKLGGIAKNARTQDQARDARADKS